MQNWMMMFTFSVFDRKYPSWANLAEKSKIVCSKWSLIQRLILIFRIQWWCFFICFRLEVPFLDKFRPKNQNCQFELKIGTQTNSNMKNSMVMFSFSVFNWKYSFFKKHLLHKSKFFVEAVIKNLIRICRIQRWF